MGKFSWILAVVLLVLVVYAGLSDARKKPRKIVDVVGYGYVQGTVESSTWSARKYLKFKNIKYANQQRFLPPTVYMPTMDIDIRKDSSGEKKDPVNLYKTKDVACPSLETLRNHANNEWEDEMIVLFLKTIGIEDCLYLSVSTRNITGSQPVMVYLAGYDVVQKESDMEEAIPNYLLEKDIVLVAVQYRVGPFGFLSTLTDNMPGNVGVLDVIEALRWIQKYISHFGGDPSRVTLFGQYHSAAIINLLTLCPVIENEKLFSQVIYQSGSALLDGIATTKPQEISKKIGNYLGCESINDILLLENCLKTARVHDLLAAYGKYVEEHRSFPFLAIGGPIGLIPDFPENLLATGGNRGYPTIGGSVKHPGVCEAMRGMNSSVFRSTYKKELDGLKKILEDIGSKNEDQVKYVDEKFPNKIFFSNIFKAAFPAMIDIKGIDIKYATSSALLFNAEKGSPSYLYAFNYLGFFSRLDCSKDVLNDVSLADDSVYLFPYPERVENLTWKDIKMAKFMVELWTSFAATGSPSAPGLHKWPTLLKGNMGPYLGIDFIYKMGYDYSEEYFITLKEQMKEKNIYDQSK